MKRAIAMGFAGAIAALVVQSIHAADVYPSKSIKLITVFAPGTGPEKFTRLWATALSRQLGQQVIIEHQPAGGGAVASQAVARAQPDGHTLLSHVMSHIILKHLQPRLAYDPIADFAPVSQIGSVALVLVAHGDGGVMKIDDFIARLRSAPGKLNYASAGVSSPAHMAAAVFLAVTGLDATHIPYKSAADMNQALTRGDVDFAIPGYSVVLPVIQAGKVRALAVTGAARMKQLPEVPTLREVMKNDLLVQESWGGIWAPARTPPSIVGKLHAAIVKALSDADLQETYGQGGGSLVTSESPEAFSAFIRRENDKWKEIVRVSGAKGD